VIGHGEKEEQEAGCFRGESAASSDGGRGGAGHGNQRADRLSMDEGPCGFGKTPHGSPRRDEPGDPPAPGGRERGCGATDHYDLEAKSEGDGPLTTAQAQEMLRALLAERFQLGTHRETQETQMRWW